MEGRNTEKIFDSHCHPQFPQDEIVRYAPLDKMLLETDAPYLTPIPFRGKRNESIYVKHVARKIAELKNLDYNQIAKQTFENTKKLFGIDV